jgi:hypothetical protein
MWKEQEILECQVGNKRDILPVNNNIIQNITRTKLTVVEDGEEEKAIADGILLDEVEYTVTKKKSLLLQNLLRKIVKLV